MGFFGFLKGKGQIAPPQKPASASGPLPPMPSTFPSLESDLPPPPQPELFDSLPGESVHDLNHVDDLDTIPLPPSTHDAPLPPPDFMSQQAQLPPPRFGDFEQPTAPSPQNPAFSLAAPPEQSPTPRQEQTVPSSMIAPIAPIVAKKTMSPTQEDIPDFSEEDIAAATGFKRKQEETKREESVPTRQAPAAKGHVHYQPLPALGDELLPPALPDELYVHAHHYQDALKIIANLRGSVRKGDGALAKLNGSVVTHKQDFSRFAEKINAIQQDFIKIDDIMIGPR